MRGTKQKFHTNGSEERENSEDEQWGEAGDHWWEGRLDFREALASDLMPPLVWLSVLRY